MNLSEALRKEVENRGISWRAAGSQIGVPYQTLSNWATGKYRPSPEMLPAIARFLKVPVAEVRRMRARDLPDDRSRLESLEAEMSELRRSVNRLLARIPDPDA